MHLVSAASRTASRIVIAGGIVIGRVVIALRHALVGGFVALILALTWIAGVFADAALAGIRSVAEQAVVA